jgi:hypothetical protein
VIASGLESQEDVQRFDEEIGMTVNPDEVAKAALKAHQEAMGMTFENPDAPVPPDAKALAYMEDQEISGGWMGR